MFDFDEIANDGPAAAMAAVNAASGATRKIRQQASIKEKKFQTSLDDLAAAEAAAAQDHMAWMAAATAKPKPKREEPKATSEKELVPAQRKRDGNRSARPIPAEPELWQELEVVHVAVLIRTEPHCHAKMCGVLKKGTVVWATEETFDGWVKLFEPAGWVLRDMQGKVGVGELLRFKSESWLLAAHDFAEQPGPQWFEVVAPGGVAACWEPLEEAESQHRLEKGHFIQGTTQSYNGWVCMPNDSGWVQAKSSKKGKYLRATFLEDDYRIPIAQEIDAVPVRTEASQADFALAVPPWHWQLLELEFEVVRNVVIVRSQPSLTSQACGVKPRGAVVKAVEETFDGWVRVDDPPGWMLRDLGGRGGVKELLKMKGVSQLIPASEQAKEPGPQRFEVIAKDGVIVRKEPMEDAAVVDTFRPDFGQVLTAVTQTYDGWLRLADGDGWVRCRSHEHGRHLTAVYMSKETIHDKRQQYFQAKEKAMREAEAQRKLENELEAAKHSHVWDKVALGGRAMPVEAVGDRGGRKQLKYLGVAEIIAARGLGASGWNIFQLPERMFMVVNADATGKVVARSKPEFSGAVCGSVTKGEAVAACEETFDGWVRLTDQPGWVPRDMGGRDSLFMVLEPLDTPEEMAVPEPSPGPSRRMFEVVYEPWVEITGTPNNEADVIGKRRAGEFILAETQTYHGWLKLADDLGWMPSVSRERGQLLRSVSSIEHADPLLALPAPMEDAEEKRREEERALEAMRKKMEEERRIEAALKELEAAAATGDGTVFRTAIKEAKRQGVPKKDIARMNALFSAG